MKKPRSLVCKVLFFTLIVLQYRTVLFGQNPLINPVEIRFSDNGNQLHGWFYKASGNGPFSTVILLHGSVGHDGDIFNLGESLSKEGFNVMTYNYPGTWKSEGNKTDESSLNSVQSAINFAKSESSIQSFKSDTSEIILLGHSYGGGMALLGSVLDSTIKKVITIALGDLSLTADHLKENPDAKNYFQQTVDGILSNPSVARGTTGKEYVESLLINRDKYDLKKYSTELAKKDMLFLVGWFDNFKRIEDDVLPLYRELKSKGADNVKIEAFETDHRFLNVQTEFTENIIIWLKNGNNLLQQKK